MSKVIQKYKLLKDLVIYPKGTEVVHEFEVLPSQFRDGDSYATDGEWYVYDGHKIIASSYLKELIKWCSTSQRTDDHHAEWIQKL